METVEIILTVKLTVQKLPDVTPAAIVSELDYSFQYMNEDQAKIVETDIQDFEVVENRP